MSKGLMGRRERGGLVKEDEIGFTDDDLGLELPVLSPGGRVSGRPVDPDAKPNPVELPGPINPEGSQRQSVEMHRNLYCQHYDGCLDEAVKKGWNSFTCLRCGLFGSNQDEFAEVDQFASQRKGW